MAPSRRLLGRSAVLALASCWVVALPSPALAATRPTPPQNPSASIISTADYVTGTARITWSKPASNGGAKIGAYTITVTPAVSGSPHSTSGSTFSYDMPGFTLGVNYTVAITATNKQDYTSYPNYVHFKAATVAQAPTHLTAAMSGVSGGKVTMNFAWKAPADDGGSPVLGYILKITPAGKTCNTAVGQLQCAIEGFSPGAHEQATVVADNAVEWSEPATLTFTVPSAPSSPSGLAATVVSWQGGTATVQLSWNAPASDGGSPVTGYQATLGGALTCSTNASTHHCQISGVAPGQYTPKVEAKNAVGASLTTSISFTVRAAPTPTPSAPPTQTATPSPTESPAPTPTETATPSATESPTPTPTETATPSPTESPAPPSSAPSPTPRGPSGGNKPGGSASGHGIDPLVVAIGLLIIAVLVAAIAALIWRRRRPGPGSARGPGGGGPPSPRIDA